MCVLCGHGKVKPGTTTITLEREDTLIVFRDVPADVCENCGEAFLDGDIVDQLQTAFDAAEAAGVQVDVRRFVAQIA